MQRIKYSDHTKTMSISCWADSYCYDSTTSSIHFLSIAGRYAEVKAILAALISNLNRHVEIQAEDKVLKLTTPSWKKMRTMIAKLPSGGWHGVLIAESRENDSSILILKATPGTIYKLLYDSFPVCAIPEWSTWLIARLEEEGYLRMLAAYNMKAAILNVTEPTLDEILSQGVAKRQIQF